MKKMSKKIISVMLCLTILSSLIVNITLFADNSSSQREEATKLIEAWENLTKEESTVIAYPSKDNAIANIPESLGLTDEQKAFMGDYFIVTDSATNYEKFVGFDSPYKLQNGFANQFTKFTYSAYAVDDNAGVRIILEGKDNANASNNKNVDLAQGILEKGFKTYDITDKMTDFASSTYYFNACTYTDNYSYGKAYVGSIIGWKSVREKAPQNAISMTDEQLLEAANLLDLSLYADGVEEFKTAKLALYKSLYPEAAALVEAWGNLTKEESTVIAYPSKDNAIANIPESLGLTAEQKALMGDYFVVTDATTNYEKFVGFDSPYKLQNGFANQFDKFTYSAYAVDDNAGVRIILEGKDSVDTSKNKNVDIAQGVLEKGFKTYDITEKMSDFASSTYYFNACTYTDNYSYGKAYVGTILGWKTKKADIPKDVTTMTLVALYSEAAAVDVSAYTSGVENFNTAKTNLYNLLDSQGLFDPENEAFSNLVTAWKSLASESKIAHEVVAIPDDSFTGNAILKEVEESTNVGISDNSLLGTHYIEKWKILTNENGTPKGWDNAPYFTMLKKDFSNYNALYLYAAAYKSDGSYASNVNLYTQINGGNSLDNKKVGEWIRVDFKTVTDITISNLKFVVLGNNPVSYISYGSVIGEFDYTPTMPENYSMMSLSELVAAAKEIDYEGFAGTEKFKTALAKADALVDKSIDLRKKLIEEWRELAIIKTDVVAVPAVSYVGTDGNTYNRVAVTDNTTVEGLTDTSDLGPYYMDKVALNTAGWENQFYLDINSNFTNLSKYDSLSLQFATYGENGDFVKGYTVFQVNGSNDVYRSGTGWTTLSGMADTTAVNIKVVVYNAPDGIAALSFGSLIGTYTIRPEIPENIDTMCFIDLVQAAASCNVEGFAADEFKTVLKDCQDLIVSRKETLLTEWQAIGFELPENVNSMEVVALIDAALSLEISATQEDISDFEIAVWMLNLLTENGQLLENLRAAWKPIAKLPSNYRMMTLAEWVAEGEKLDVSAADESQQLKFKEALDAVRDLLSKGKSDVERLKKLCKDAESMNYYDFTEASWIPFEIALKKANNVLENYSHVTQNTVDTATEELLTVWGELRVYIRTQWVDFLSYYLKEDPAMNFDQGKGMDTSASAIKTTFPNGANAGVGITTQNAGWYPVSVGGVRLENLTNYELLEVWIKVDPDESMTALLWQFNKSGGGLTYDATFNLPEGAKCGEWYRLELPLSKFKNSKEGLLLDNEEYQAASVSMMIIGDTSSYSMSNIVAVKTQSVTAGVVPNIPKMEIKEREQATEAAPPKNPFVGIDRNDPWGLLERPNNKKEDITVSDTTKDTWGTEEVPNTDTVEIKLVETGTCGDNLTWNFYDDGTLKIEGKGNMENYEGMAPWVAAGYDIKFVIIADGVTSIGDSAFYGCKNLVSIYVPASVVRVGDFAFYECYSLTELKVSSGVKEIGAYAFGYVFDSQNNTAKILDGFKLLVCDPSEALKYAKTYEVPYEVYQTADSVIIDDGFVWWFWAIIAAGTVVILSGITVLVIVLIKKKKNAKVMEVVK